MDAALAAGAQVEVRDDAGLTALMLAARAGHAVVVERLLAAGANPNCTANVPAVDGQVCGMCVHAVCVCGTCMLLCVCVCVLVWTVISQGCLVVVVVVAFFPSAVNPPP